MICTIKLDRLYFPNSCPDIVAYSPAPVREYTFLPGIQFQQLASCRVKKVIKKHKSIQRLGCSTKNFGAGTISGTEGLYHVSMHAKEKR